MLRVPRPSPWRGAARRRRSPSPIAPLATLTALVVALLPAVAPDALARPLPQEGSPADGHAQVIAQGVAPLPAVPVAWRVIAADARPPGLAPVAERSLGFVVADVAPFVVTGEDGRQVRLAPGEGRFVAQGERHRRTGLPDQPVGYFGLELVVAPDASADYSLGDAALLYASDPFAAPPGRRDLDLVRDVLAPGETTGLPATAAPTLLVATEGRLRVERADGRRLTLTSGDAQALSGPLAITATGSAPASFVAAVIGPAVEAPAVSAPPPPVATGAISLAPYACPVGMRPETLDLGACAPAPDVMALQLFVPGSGANRRTSADATVADGVFTWDGLPFGEYVVQATDLAPGYDRYVIPGLGGLNAGTAPPQRGYTVSPNEGHLLSLDPAAPRPDLGVYAFRAAATPGPATLGLFLQTCPPGVVAAPDLRQAGCLPIDPFAVGFDVRLDADELPRPLTLADALATDAGGYLWEGLPYANYTLSVTLPPGYDGYALRSYRTDFSVTPLDDRTGYVFALDDALFAPGDLRRVNIDAYLLTE